MLDLLSQKYFVNVVGNSCLHTYVNTLVTKIKQVFFSLVSCSVKCYKEHDCSIKFVVDATPSASSATTEEELIPTYLLEIPEDFVVPPEKLEKLKESKELKQLLQVTIFFYYCTRKLRVDMKILAGTAELFSTGQTYN